MTLDNPMVRNDRTCPLCLGSKDKALVACWSCYREHGLKYGNAAAERKISARETYLAERNR
jgi:hypothetical protein